MGIDVLPLDVFVIVCGYLDPNDVLKLAFVNENTRDLVYTRTVWIDQLLAVIHENGLYAPTFPLRKMSVCELMQTACGPGRMVNRFWAKHKVSGSAEDPPLMTHQDRQQNVYNHPPLKRLPNSTAYELPFISRHDLRSLDVPEGVPPPEDIFSDGPSAYTKICLIPGGRFLACVAEQEAFIWDLGPPAQSKHFTPTIYCRWPVVGDEIFMPGPSADGKELRLVMGSMGSSDLTGTLTIYRIWEQELQHQTPSTPHSGQENEETISSVVTMDSHTCPLYAPDQITFFTIVGDIFVYIYRAGPPQWPTCYVVNVWDFVSDKYASWNVAKSFSEAFVDNGFLCMVNLPEVNVAGWKIPPLKSWKEHRENRQGDIIVPPSFRVGLGGSSIAGLTIPGGNFTGLIGRMLDWYNVLKPLQKFDGVIFNEEDRTEFWTYGMCDWPTEWSQEESGIQNSHQVTSSGQGPPYVQLQHVVTFLGDLASFAAITVDPYRICEGYTVKNLVSSDSKAWIMVELPEDPPGQESTDAQQSIDGMQCSRKVITIELDIPYPVLPPPITITTTDIGDDGQIGEASATADTISENTVDQLAVELGELSLNCENLTLPEPDDLRGRTDFSFDPCSGRFCYIAAGRQQIGIAEFLKWG